MIVRVCIKLAFMKLLIVIVLLLYPAVMFPARLMVFPTGDGVVARDTGWMSRVTRAEASVIRDGRPWREGLARFRKITAGITGKEGESRERKVAAFPLTLRANLLRWATLTPDIGAEWRLSRRWGVTVDGAWTSWSWQNADRRYATWHVSPGIRYYPGKTPNVHVGAEFHTGKFNYKLGITGRQGSYRGSGLMAGYRLPLNRSFALDFSAGLGYTRLKYDKYRLVNGVRVEQGSVRKGRWGVTKLGVTLDFKF